MASPKDNLAEKQKDAVRPMVGVLRLEKLLRQRRSCGLGDSARNPGKLV